ncbi:MAG: type II toxin-antitoxin system mRNA interferase toxin, RelE/StbE family [Candidatus Angelobacter sp. Gp1-AA117]|nr:MAG: type II toxin-antitoxin system mRNA interferase toxin, RelE/StbE family [Candidatus Angelobacter sp. Gp1-AA117]
MAHRVIWTSSANANLDAIAAYISADSPAYARNVVKKLSSITNILSHFPNSGRQVPEFQDPAIRELLAYSYRIIYTIMGNEVFILTIIHGKRNLV